MSEQKTNGSKSWFMTRLAALGGASIIAKALPLVAVAGAVALMVEGVVILRRMKHKRECEEETRRNEWRRQTRTFEEEEGDAMR